MESMPSGAVTVPAESCSYMPSEKSACTESSDISSASVLRVEFLRLERRASESSISKISFKERSSIVSAMLPMATSLSAVRILAESSVMSMRSPSDRESILSDEERSFSVQSLIASSSFAEPPLPFSSGSLISTKSEMVRSSNPAERSPIVLISLSSVTAMFPFSSVITLPFSSVANPLP